MGFLDTITLPKSSGTSKLTGLTTGGFLSSVIMPTAGSTKVAGYNADQVAYDQASKDANSFGTLAKETLKGIVSVPINAVKNTWETYQQTPDKIASDIQAGASDLQQGSGIKGVLKAGGRTAGDVAIAIFAPLSAAIGAVVNASGGQNLTDKAGQIIANGTGITDIPAFQKFAMSHPNAGEDFNRILTLAMSVGDKSKIDPAKLLDEVKSTATKLVDHGTITPAETSAKPKSFIESVTLPENTKIEQAQAPVKETLINENTPEGNAVSGVAKSIESKAIEAKLNTEYPDKATFESSTFEEQANKTAELINSGIDNARAVVRGDIPMPEGLKAAPLIAGMEEYAKLHPAEAGDIMSELANSHLATTISEGASETSFARMREPDSASAKLAEIRKAKVQTVGGEKVVADKKASFIKEATRNVLPKEEANWDKFLDSIKC